jgi:hypothetical protein
MVVTGLLAGTALAQTATDAPPPGGQAIPDVISPDPIAPGVDAPALPPPPAASPAPGTGPIAPELPQDAIEGTEAREGDAMPPPPDAVMMAAEAVEGFIRGRTYQGLDAASGAVVATVSYGMDGTSVLTLPDGTTETGTYRFEGDAYCTRYEQFRDGRENCFTLEERGDGTAQAWYTDGRRALVLAPAT